MSTHSHSSPSTNFLLSPSPTPRWTRGWEKREKKATVIRSAELSLPSFLPSRITRSVPRFGKEGRRRSFCSRRIGRYGKGRFLLAHRDRRRLSKRFLSSRARSNARGGSIRSGTLKSAAARYDNRPSRFIYLRWGGPRRNIIHFSRSLFLFCSFQNYNRLSKTVILRSSRKISILFASRK